MIRQPIITVLGHVDHGKTSILDAIRSSRVAVKEAGAITQHIGATEIPLKSIQNIAGNLLEKFGFQLKIPGVLVIDTPGHEAFTNLRKRGGSIADLAVLVIDIMQGIQPQTKEAIEILKINKVPFIIALNKVDMLSFYESKEGSFIENVNKMNKEVQQKLDEKVYAIVGDLYKEGFASERFDRCEFGKEIPIVPCSAHTKEGLPEILTLLAGLSQKYLEKNLEIEENEAGKGAVLETKEEKGLGKTIDVVLYNGKIKTNDTIGLVGKNGIIKTKVRALLQPKSMQEMISTKDKFSSVKEISAAAGIKIAAPNIDNVIAGSIMRVIEKEEDLEELKMEEKEISHEMDEKGIIVKADTIGSLEALIQLFKKEGIGIKKGEIGNVVRKDVIEAGAMHCENPLYSVVIAFGVNVEKEAEKEAKEREVKIFSDKVIYNLIEGYKKWNEEEKRKEKEEGMKCLVWPGEIEVMKGKVFRNNNPAIFGAKILRGKIKEGIKAINKDGKIIGKITGMQEEGKNLKEVVEGKEVAMAIDNGKIGKNLFEGDKIYTCIPKNHYCELEKFQEEMSEEEKELIKEIKTKQMNIETEE